MGGTYETDLPDGFRWDRLRHEGVIEVTYLNVPEYTARFNGRYDDLQYMCGEWPPGVFQTPYGIPRAWIDGIEVSVTPRHEPRLELGCNFFIEVRRP